jgi:hypothetical protein
MFGHLFLGIGLCLLGLTIFMINLIHYNELGLLISLLAILIGILLIFSALKDWGVL